MQVYIILLVIVSVFGNLPAERPVVEVVEPVWGCPKDYVMKGKKCSMLAAFPAEKKCPNSYVLSKEEECLKKIYSKGQEVCEDGFSMLKGMCVRTLSEEPNLTCREGFTYDVDRDMCERLKTADRELQCVDGTLEDDTCIQTITEAPDALCPPDYEERHSEASGGIYCSLWNDEVVDVSVKCPARTYLKDGMCESRGTPRKKCREGFTMNKEGMCVKKMVTHMQSGLSCPDGYEVVKNMCVETRHESPTLTCPNTFSISDQTKLCMKADVARSRYLCGEGSLVNGMCVTRDQQAAMKVCNEGSLSMDGQTCQMKDIVPAVQQCAPGFDVVDGQCVKVVETPATKKCRRGYYLINNICQKFKG